MDLPSSIARGACALALLVLLPAAAEEPGSLEAVWLDEVVVRLPRGELAQAPAAAATVVDAGRFAGEAKGVAELVAVSPGVDVQRYGTAGQLSTLAIRGVAADGVKVLLDGLPLGGVAGTVDLSTIPRAWIRKVEVVRGPSGATFGAGALGGAVNVVTRSASGASAELSGGSFGTYALSAEAGGPVGPFSLLLGLNGEATAGDFPYRYDATPDAPHNDPLVHAVARNNGSRRGGLLLKLGGPLGGDRLDALVQLSGGHRGLQGPVRNPTPDNWEDDGRALAMVRVTHEVGEDLTLSARLHGRADLLDARIAGLGSGPARQRGGAGGAQVEAELRQGGARLGAVASADEEGYSGAALGGGRDRFTLAAALTGDLPLGPVSVGPALRVERAGRLFGVSGNLGARISLPGDLRLRASAGRTYRVPAFAELYLRQGGLEPNPDLRPSRGLGGDAALIYDGPRGLLSLGGFLEREDEIITYEPAAQGRFRPQNTQAALLRGLELETATAALPAAWNLTLQVAWTVLRSEVLEGPPGIVGQDLPRRPRQQLYARAAISPRPFELHADLRSVRRQFSDGRNTIALPDAASLGAGASVQVLAAPRVSLHLQIDNLADRRDLQDGFGNPLPGRSVMLTVRAGSSEKGVP